MDEQAIADLVKRGWRWMLHHNDEQHFAALTWRQHMSPASVQVVARSGSPVAALIQARKTWPDITACPECYPPNRPRNWDQ